MAEKSNLATDIQLLFCNWQGNIVINIVSYTVVLDHGCDK